MRKSEALVREGLAETIEEAREMLKDMGERDGPCPAFPKRPSRPKSERR
jgi:hypothetical protein